MKSEHVELIKKLLQQEITSCDEDMFDETGAVDDWNCGRLYLAEQMLYTIEMLEQREHKEEMERE